MFNSFKTSGTGKILVASAVLAFGSITAAGSLAAGEAGQGRDTPRSANYYTKNSHKVTHNRKKAKSNARRRNKRAKRNVARNHVAPRAHIRKERRNDRIKRNVKRAIGIIASGVLNEPRVIYRDYGPRRGFRGRHFNDFCVAVARTRGGYGRRLGIRAEGHGRRACRKAMRRCNRRLDFRQSTGRNPYAACVVARRG